MLRKNQVWRLGRIVADTKASRYPISFTCVNDLRQETKNPLSPWSPVAALKRLR